MSLFSRFSEEAKRALALAATEAVDLGYAFIGTEHLLLGILATGGRVASILSKVGITLQDARDAVETRSPKGPSWDQRDARMLSKLGIDLAQVKSKVEEEFGEGSLRIPAGRPPFTPRSRRTLETALQLADAAGSDEFQVEHIALALLEDPDGMAARVMSEKAPNAGALKSALDTP